MVWLKNRRRGLFFALALLTFAVTLLAAACGDDAEEADSGGATDDGPASFDISLGDEPGEGKLVSFFTPDEFTVAPGQEVTFNISNDGTAPHNVRIAGPDGEYNTDDDTVVDPEILNPGDTAVLVWTAPSEPGIVMFRCDFHLNTGTITVE
jgi:plastocyanin